MKAQIIASAQSLVGFGAVQAWARVVSAEQDCMVRLAVQRNPRKAPICNAPAVGNVLHFVLDRLHRSSVRACLPS